MAFQEFRKTDGNSEPKVTLRANSNSAEVSGAVRGLMGSPARVKWLWDAEAGRIGLRVSENGEAGYPLRKSRQGHVSLLSSGAFVNRYGVPAGVYQYVSTESGVYIFEREGENGLSK